MARLCYHHAMMTAGRSTPLLKASYNHPVRRMNTRLPAHASGTRAAAGISGPRLGIEAPANTLGQGANLFGKPPERLAAGPVVRPLVDAAQVRQPARAARDPGLPVMCYGLGVGLLGRLFPGSAPRLALADDLHEARMIRHCGRRATMVVRKDAESRVPATGDRTAIGGNEGDERLGRRHGRAAMGGLA